MRRRYHRKIQRPTQNLDSFLDILTNTVGVLMFITLFVTLVSVESGTIVRTPLESSSQKSANFFEARKNQVTYIDTESVHTQMKQMFDSLPTCKQPEQLDSEDLSFYNDYLAQIRYYQDCLAANLQEIKNFQIKTAYYDVEILDLERLSRRYEPLENVQGESPKALKQTNSEFERIISQLNPQTDYLAFVVRPDSFEAFRQAREIAWKAGFDVGWEPKTAETPIIFSSEGRAVGVQ